jgi:hypothetical protein
MKTKFIGPIRDQLNSNKVLLWGLRSKNDQKTPDPRATRNFSGVQAMSEGIDFVGNEFRIPLRSGRNQATGARAENTALMAAGAQGFLQISGAIRSYYGVFNVTGQLIKASESDVGAFKRAVKTEMDLLVDDLKRKLNIHAYGDGTGVLATLTSVGGAPTYGVDTTIYFQGGEVCDLYDSTLTTYRGTVPRTVTSYSRSGLTLTFDAAFTGATIGDVLIGASTNSTNTVPNNDRNNAVDGLDKIINSTGALHGLNPATAGQSFWASSNIAAAGAVVGDNLLRQLVDSVGFESGSDQEMILITTRGIRNRYANTLTALKQFNDDKSVVLQGGFRALMFDDTPMVIDDHCRKGRVWASSMDNLFWAQSSDWDWATDQNGGILNLVQGFDKYEAYLYKYCNLGTTARNRHGRITGAADDTA